MILKVVKTYSSNKIALCVAIVESEFADLTSLPAFLHIKKAVTVGQLIEIPGNGVRVETESVNEETSEVSTFTYWKLEA